MKKQKNRKSKKRNNRITAINKKANQPIQPIDNFINYCENLTKSAEITNKYDADYYFCKAIIAREEKQFQLERQSIINLLMLIDDSPSELINGVLSGNLECGFSESTKKILSSIRVTNENIHPYIQLITAFILSGTKQQIQTYFNCFMGKSANTIADFPQLDINKVSDTNLMIFYEFTHRILIDDSSNLTTLEKLTTFIFNRVNGNACESLFFFVSYFRLNSNDATGAIEAARQYLDAESLPVNTTNYLTTLAWNTALAAIRIADIDEAEFWLDYIEDEEKHKKIAEDIESAIEKSQAKVNHPLNPENIHPEHIDKIGTVDLITLCAFLDGCGDDWGLKELKRAGKYIYPSESLTIKSFKLLALKGIIKIPQVTFNNIPDKYLSDFDTIVFNYKFHTNIIGVSDTKQIALSILLEEIERRDDRFEASLNVWKEISIGYFYSAMEYYLNNVKDNWAVDFTLNEKTAERISLSGLSAKELSSIAQSSIRYVAGKHQVDSEKSNKRTCNSLIASINRNFDWIETGQYLSKLFPRGEKIPVLSSEKILEKICNLTPEEIYDLSPDITRCYGIYFSDEDEF